MKIEITDDQVGCASYIVDKHLKNYDIKVKRELVVPRKIELKRHKKTGFPYYVSNPPFDPLEYHSPSTIALCLGDYVETNDPTHLEKVLRLDPGHPFVPYFDEDIKYGVLSIINVYFCYLIEVVALPQFDFPASKTTPAYRKSSKALLIYRRLLTLNVFFRPLRKLERFS